MQLTKSTPRVSIGLPVFNGERFLEDALDSILDQTYSAFELVISDNASTDRTEKICRDYVARDSRIRYYRNKKNIGAPQNFNLVFKLSSGEYFKWASCDDKYAADYLQKCMSVLATDPSIILCHSKTGRINEHGKLVGNYDRKSIVGITSLKPHERFGVFLNLSIPCWDIFGVILRSSLAKTPLQGSYVGADRNLLAEIALMGRMYEIPEYLFFGRDHSESYTTKFYGGECFVNIDNHREQLAFWTADKLILPTLKNCIEYSRSINRTRLKWSERILCHLQIFRWFINEGWRFLGEDLKNFLFHYIFHRYIPKTQRLVTAEGMKNAKGYK